MSEIKMKRISEKEWYFGELSDDETLQNGIGMKKERDGSLYYGGWNNGLREGFGILCEPDGGMRIGYWTEDQLSEVTCRLWHPSSGLMLFMGTFENMRPKEGTLFCKDGRIYHGIFTEWRKEEFDGEGALVWPNQRIYGGRWKNGGTDIGGVIRRPDKTDGRLIGTLSNVRKGFVAKSWSQESEKQFFYGITSDDEVRNSNGILFYRSGEFYAGEMIGGKRMGAGIYRDADMSVCFGNWTNNSLEGEGVYVSLKDDIITCYTGSFSDGKFDGRGCLVRRVLGEWDFIYSGSWKDNQKSGMGVLNAENGQFFIGGFKSDLKDGTGEDILENGSRVSMIWKNGIPDVSMADVTKAGPERNLHGESEKIEKATINSVRFSNGEDEMSFLGIRADENAEYQKTIKIDPGCDYEVCASYHNDSNSSEGMAKETKIKVFYSKSIGTSSEGVISVAIISEDTETPIIWDCVRLQAEEDIPVSYKIASARIHNKRKSNEHILPQTLFTEEGTYLGADDLDGILPAGESGTVTFIIHAGGKKDDNSISFGAHSKSIKTQDSLTVVDTSSVKVVPASIGGVKKRKRSRVSIKVLLSAGSGEYVKEVSADLGEEINAYIEFTNSARQQDIKLSVELPSDVEYVVGSTYLTLLNGTSQKQDDNWISQGLELLDFAGEGEGTIRFKLRYLPSDGVPRDNKVLAIAETADVSMRGVATVVGN